MLINNVPPPDKPNPLPNHYQNLQLHLPPPPKILYQPVISPEPPPPPPEPVSSDKSTDIEILSEPLTTPKNVNIFTPSNDFDTNEPLLNENSEKDIVSSKVSI